MTADLTPRLDDFARRLEVLENELAELKALADPVAVEPALPPPPMVPPPPPVVPPPPPTTPPVARQPMPAVPPMPPRKRREIDWSIFLGAKALAWAGGAVMLLGIVFFFVLAVNRGWIGPSLRVALGACTSAFVFAAGFYVKRRYEDLYHSAVAAVGVGIAGGYMTLLAATLLYDLVPDLGAILIAAAIAAIGTATAVAWSSELIAGLGLVGATLAPAAVGIQSGELTAAGTAFAGLVFAATAIVAVRERWSRLLVVGVVTSLPQAAVLLADAGPREWDVVAAASFLWLLTLGAAIAWQERLEAPKLATLPASLTILTAVFAGLGAASQFDERAEGWALLAVAAVYGGLAATLFPARRHRDLSALLGAIGLAVAAVALADLLSGPTLAVAWSAEAAVLAWLARRIDESRYQIVSFAYLGAALVHALAIDAPLTHLYRAVDRPAEGAVAFVALALAAGIVTFYCRPWPEAASSRLLAVFMNAQGDWRLLAGSTALLSGIYAGSLGVLGIAQRVSSGPVEPAFWWGHVGVIALWSAIALALIAAGHQVRRIELRIAGLVWLGAVLAQLVFFTGTELEGDPRGWAFAAGALGLLGGVLLDRARVRDDTSLACAGLYGISSIGLGVAAVFDLVDGSRNESFVLLGLAAAYGALGALATPRDRDLGTLLWAPPLVVAGYASWQLLDGTWLVLAWAVASSALVALAARTGERRLEAASFAFLVLTLARALAFEAPLGDLFESSKHPESGVPALLCAIGALIVFALCLGRGAGELTERTNPYNEIAHMLDAQRELWRRAAEIAAAVLCVYAVSLTILGIAEAVGGGSIQTNFERGHSAVSALWGLIGLAVLYVGLRRRISWLRFVGFGLFGLALVKLFVYDLAYLSSVTRALSFLAVGSLLLVAGFFVQRLDAARSDAAT